jgi:A/G-specific adenine glycosylase
MRRSTAPARLGTATQLRRLARALLDWYAANRRDLPWRRASDPYHIWVAEVMLQQTQVATVIPYYERFLARFPTLVSLAESEPDEVLQLWQGLGYYSRARNLQAGTRHVLREHGGQVPSDAKALRRCPGIGDYTAGAIRSIAFDLPAAAVDGNVERVLCRLLAADGDPKRSPLRGELRAICEGLEREGPPREMTQALMELGATVCLPKSPQCEQCPWDAECRACQRDSQDQYPRPRTRPATVEVSLACAVCLREGQVLLERRADRRFWKTMWTLPYTVDAEGGDDREALAEVQCGVTHHRIRLVAYLREGSAEAGEHRRWVPLGEIAEVPMPAPMRRLVEEAVAGGR